MGKATLVIMAAGIGSRFAGGIKQLEPVGPNGEIIMDYSIYDAVEAGFDKVVFVIRKSLEEDFKRIIGSRVEEKVTVNYVFQELENIPEKHKDKLEGRVKPWGTGHAILSCKDVVHEPFLVINSDDYYGKMSYREMYQYLTSDEMLEQKDKLSACMVGFVLKNTLSDNGGVTRGICKMNEQHFLTDIEEMLNVTKCGDGVKILSEEGERVVDGNSEVSMNMWGFTPKLFEILEDGFDKFFEEMNPEDKKAEFLLPKIIGQLLKNDEIEVKVLPTNDVWFGVTYKEDKDKVVKAIQELIDAGLYK